MLHTTPVLVSDAYIYLGCEKLTLVLVAPKTARKLTSYNSAVSQRSYYRNMYSNIFKNEYLKKLLFLSGLLEYKIYAMIDFKLEFQKFERKIN